jgi:hypothetical protein
MNDLRPFGLAGARRAHGAQNTGVSATVETSTMMVSIQPSFT